MLINNPDALKSWLVVVLEPLCDADSSALARYVLALVKKDKPEEELKRMMIDQLDVFLANATNSFVTRLFHAINTEEYLNLPSNIPPVLEGISSSPTNTNHVIDLTENVIDDTTESTVTASLSNVENVIKTDQSQDNSSSYRETKVATTNSQSSSSNSASNIQKTEIYHNKTKETQSNASKEQEIIASDRSTSSAQQQQPAHNSNGSSNVVVSSSVSHQNHSNQVRSVSPLARANADKENQPRDSRRRRASLRSRSTSRSRSNDRALRRSRSRDRRANEREKNQRQFRNKSPSNNDQRHNLSGSGLGGSRRGFDRRRLGGIGGGSGPNEDRPSRFGSGNVSSGNGKNRQIRSNSPRSRSPTPERQRSGHIRNSPDRHHPPPPHHHPQIPQHPHQHDVMIMSDQRQRCRDFDEKGYCVRGETCPWDHGVNPVVFEGINNSALISMSLREYNPDAPEIWSRSGPTAGVPPPHGANSINPFSGNARPSGMIPPLPVNPPVGPGGPTDYSRGTSGPMIQFPFNPTAVTTPLQRQLVPIPVVDGNNGMIAGGAAPGTGGGEIGKRRFELEDTVAIAEGPPKRKVPMNSRLGPRVDRANMQQNCSLELRKVPRGLNTIAHLNNHFAKFGKIINIQVSYDGDPEAAIITFSAHAEANVAYRSTEAVLNNRFIKVFWHSQDNTNSNGNETNINSNANNTGRKNTSQYHLHNVPAVPTPTADSAKTSNTSQVTTAAQTAGAQAEGSANNASAAATVNSGETTAATTALPSSMRLKRGPPSAAIIRKKQEEQAKAVVQLANGLRKRKQELLQSYVKQVKSALELVERCEPSDPQRAKTLSTIKVLQETIDKLRKEIAAEQEQIQAQINSHQSHLPPTKKTKEQQKKELLDIELELFAQQQEGSDTSAIQKRVEELQRNLGISSSGANTQINANSNTKVSHYAKLKSRNSYPEGSTRVDRRPKTIVVTGFAAEDADFVLGHFKHYGEITKHDVDRDIPQLILSYATRINAEQAVIRGKIFKDKRLQISWAPIVPSVSKSLTTKGIHSVGTLTAADNDNIKLENPKQLAQSVSESDSIIAGDTLPELRLEDEEEDDESEDRSWRR